MFSGFPTYILSGNINQIVLSGASMVAVLDKIYICTYVHHFTVITSLKLPE